MARRKAWLVGLSAAIIIIGAVSFYRAFYVVPVFMYHRIGYPAVEKDRANTVSPERFRAQMNALKVWGYRVLSMDDYARAVDDRKNLCCRSVVITFDDGILNNYTEAFPVLREHGFSAAFFIPAAKVGRLDIDPPRMSWPQLEEMARAGMTIGSHLLTEPYLPELTPEARRQEIVESRRILEEKLARPVKYLAYPVGGFTPDAGEMVREAGYRLAFTTNRGHHRLNRDPFELRRVRVNEKDRGPVLWAKLSGFYNFFRTTKNPY
ncbi:MAG: polysaccharide deacetylase family protein [Elusimicrobia bacterium]|nr:polysaccharide deacetylase family protein [Elusimicrobiota bacterium]